MKIIKVKDLQELKLNGKRAVALGLFDSMHLGHTRLIDENCKKAKKNNLISTVITVTKPVKKIGGCVFPLEHRIEKISEFDVDELIIIEMNQKIQMSNPQEFIKLLANINTNLIVCGADYRFGHNGEGNVSQLEKKFKTIVIPYVEFQGKKISTTTIKEELLVGNIKHVNKLLGYNYYIKGVVDYGKQLGRTIGVPTANIYPKISPLATGVYLTKTEVNGKEYKSITNIGYNPTIGENRLSVETFIGEGFDEDIYEQEIIVRVYEKIRDEKAFDSIESLAKQLQMDIKYMEEKNYEDC